MPVPTTISITYNGTDITNKVLFSTARFDSTAHAGVGMFQFTVKDVDQSLSFVTGKEIRLFLDGQPLFGGFLTQVRYHFAIPVADTTTPADVTTRQFTLVGVSYNTLFDRLVARDTADYTTGLPFYAAGTNAGTMVMDLFDNYLDIPSGFTASTSEFVDMVGVTDPQGEVAWVRGGEQGVTWREEMEWVSLKNAAIYYIDAQRRLHYHSPDSVFSRWGFSDRPNNQTITLSPEAFQGALYGFREMNTDQDITAIVNDVFVWGGSEWAGTEGGTVFARRTNTDSVATHGRWQAAEKHFGESAGGLGIQEGVDARAEAIVGGPNSPYVGTSTGSEGTVTRNQSIPAWNLSLSWFAHDEPTISGTPNHLTPGDIVTIVLWVHGSGPTNPLILTLPLRSMSISFPTLPSGDSGNKTFVRFDGSFSLSVNDPFDLWQALRRRRAEIRSTIITSSGPTGATVVGAHWSGDPNETPNGSITHFTFSTASGIARYSAGTSEVYLNGLRLRQGHDYEEDPAAGAIDLNYAPSTGSSLWAYLRLAG